MPTNRSRETMMCPATGQICTAKEYICSILDGILRNTGDIRADLALRELSEHLKPEEAAEARTQVVAELGERALAVEADLGSDCNGIVCGPIMQIATRYMLYGTSISELLTSEAPV